MSLNREERARLEELARQAGYAAIVDITKKQNTAYTKFQSLEAECGRVYRDVYNATLDILRAEARGENN